jgi:hypothetical protein
MMDDLLSLSFPLHQGTVSFFQFVYCTHSQDSQQCFVKEITRAILEVDTTKSSKSQMQGGYIIYLYEYSTRSRTRQIKNGKSLLEKSGGYKSVGMAVINIIASLVLVLQENQGSTAATDESRRQKV